MRKKLLALITVICMTLGCAVPVFGAPVISNPDVQATYDSYKALETALYAKPGDYAAVKSAYDAFVAGTNEIDTDAEEDEWMEVGGYDAASVGITAASVVMVFEKDMDGLKGLIENAANYGDLRIAYGLVENYTMLEADGVDMDGMAAGISTLYGEGNDEKAADVYAAAEKKVADTNKDVFAVYDAYMMMYEALDGEWVDDYPEAIAEFDKVAYLVDGDTTNGELSLEDAIDLGILIGETNAEDVLKEVNDTYAEIKAAVVNPNPGGGNEGGVGERIPEPEDNNGKGKSPDTGDDMNVLPFAVIMALAAAGAVAAVRRRA